jgi:hypothetical protein
MENVPEEGNFTIVSSKNEKCNLTTWKLTGECLRITCNSVVQKSKIMAIDALCDRQVEVTEPWALERAEASKSNSKSNSERFFIGIAHGVPIDTDWNACALKNSCAWIRPLSILKKENECCSVIAAYNDNIPSFLLISQFLRIRLQKYIPRPMQCKNCWAFGHLQKHCRNRVVCEVCAKHGHSKEACSNGAAFKCVNCRQRHGASSRECDK